MLLLLLLLLLLARRQPPRAPHKSPPLFTWAGEGARDGPREGARGRGLTPFSWNLRSRPSFVMTRYIWPAFFLMCRNQQESSECPCLPQWLHRGMEAPATATLAIPVLGE